MAVNIVTKRIYEPPGPDDGHRVLVDRLWPRGMSRERAQLDEWLPDVAPSTELRKWFNHDPRRWDEFCRRYSAELETNTQLGPLSELAGRGRLTLLFSARDIDHNQAVALANHLVQPTQND